MKIPSATGIVLASLAFSGSALSAPTLPPSSPNPNSPNPGAHSPHPLDSPRIDSPRSLHQAFFNSYNKIGRREPAIRSGSGSRRSIPQWAKRSDSPSTSPEIPGTALSTEGLGLDLPDTVIGPLVGHSGSTIIEVLPRQVENDREDAPESLATPMTRSLAQLSIRDTADDGTIHAEGLGIIDKSAADTIVDAIHKVAITLPTPLNELVDGVGPILGGILGPKSPPQRRQLRFMRRQVSAPAFTQNAGPADPGQQTVNAEGLGLLPAGTVGGILNGVLDTVSQSVPVVGPLLGGLLHPVVGIVDGVVSRDVHDTSNEDGENKGRRSFIPIDPQQMISGQGGVYSTASSLPSSQLPHYFVTTANGEVIDLAGQLNGNINGNTGQQLSAGAQAIPQSVGSMIGSVGATLPNGAQSLPYYVPGAASRAQGASQVAAESFGIPNQIMDQFGNIIPPQVGGVVSGATGLLGSVIGFIPGVGNVRIPQQPATSTVRHNTIIGYLANGTPVFGDTQSSAYDTSSPSPQHSGQQGLPIGGILDVGSSVVSSLPGGSAVTGVLQNVQLPAVSGDRNGGLFGILSDTEDEMGTNSFGAPASATSLIPSSTAIHVPSALHTGVGDSATVGGPSDVSSASATGSDGAEAGGDGGSEYESGDESAGSEGEEEEAMKESVPTAGITSFVPDFTNIPASKPIDPALFTQTASALAKANKENIQSVDPDGAPSMPIPVTTIPTIPSGIAPALPTSSVN